METPPENNATRIPAQTAAEVRRLAHDLSNALEIIMQANYLLQLAQLHDNARQWAAMVDKGTQQAVTINRQLRDFVRENT